MITSNGWHGHLNLVYTYRDEQTLITHQQTQSPLKIQRPFYPEGKQICHSVVLHTAGGMVGGDCLSQTIHLQPNSNALITTAAASKVYNSNGKPTQHIITLNLEENTCLEWFPQETILFNYALYHQQLRVNLGENATLFLWDITRLGRTARGEQFSQGKWRSHTEIWQKERPLWIDRQRLSGGDLITRPNGLGGYSMVGTLIYLGQSVNDEVLGNVRELWHNWHDSGEMGVTQSLGDGVICRYRGHSTSVVRGWFGQIWHLFRQMYLQRPPIYPRVWLI